MDEKLEVPEETQRRMRWMVSLHFPGDTPMVAWCAEWTCHPVGHILELRDVLVNTSKRVQGITTTKQLTHHEKLLAWGGAAFLRPFRFKVEEKENPDGG